MTQEDKDKLIALGRKDLVDIWEFQQEGYAGILPSGTIVDRRLHPEAIPISENRLLNVPPPKNIKE